MLDDKKRAEMGRELPDMTTCSTKSNDGMSQNRRCLKCLANA